MKEKNTGQTINDFAFENGLFSETIQLEKEMTMLLFNVFNFVCIAPIYPSIVQ